MYQSQRRSRSTMSNSYDTRRWRRNQNTTAFVAAIKLGPVAHTVLVAMMVAVLGLLYLTQVTKTSAYSYDLNERETKLADLRAEQQELKIENARLQALERVQGSAVAANMQRPDAVDYAQ